MMIHTILHPTDFSGCSEYARQLAYSLSCDHGARLVVVHVAPGDLVHADFIDGADHGKPCLRELESQILEIFRDVPGIHAEIHMTEGEPASAILRSAEEVQADMIVMGTTGRSGLGRLLLGSVAEAVMHGAKCPVLTVRCPVDVRSPGIESPAEVGA